MKQPTQLIKTYLRQLSVSPEKKKKKQKKKDTPIKIWHKGKMDCYERSNY